VEGVLAVCVSLWAIGLARRRRNYLRPLARCLASAAYGAFIVHPPVIVELAFAVQPLPAPAELKFITVLLAAVSGSFGLSALASRTGSIAWIIGSGPRVEPRDPAARATERPACPTPTAPGA
jgi:glucan biosynthesis protein C